jgi:flagella basal body P-ring formation protein FlgA
MIVWMLLGMSPPPCLPVESGHLLASDLARAVPEFAAAPPDADVGYAPLPGVQRVFRSGELRRLALRFHIRLVTDREVCFAWPAMRINAEDAVRAMRESLGLAGAKIQILELSNQPAPPGRIVFPLASMLPAADRNSGSALWRGYLLYAEDRKFDIWARVKLLAPTARVVATSDIAAGHIIHTDDVRVETVDDFPIWKEVSREPGEVVGHIAQRSIAKGRAVLRNEVSNPLAIKSGDIVQVDVENGRAHVKLQAVAENSGRAGETIRFRNPRSGKYFRAQVVEKGRALVTPSVAGGMVN